MINEKILKVTEETNSSYLATKNLVSLGRQQGYVTLDDVLYYFPNAEDEIEQLDEVLAALISTGIPFVEDSDSFESKEKSEDTEEETQPKKVEKETPIAENPLANIDPSDMVGLYLKQAAEVPLLTHQEEIMLSKLIEQGRFAQDKLAREEIEPRLRRMLRRDVDEGWKARDRLIISNSRLVISVAKKYIGRGVPFLDLIQEGNIGLMRAAKKFDYHRGFKFSTYATWWIRQAVTRAIADQGRTIRVPVHMGDQISRLRRVQNQLKQRLAREPTLDELATELELPIKKIENMIKVARRPLSLEMPIDDERDALLGDFIEDDDVPAPAESASQNLLREQLVAVLDSLPPREVRVLQLRFGLSNGKTCTLEQVGRKMGVTRERVRQIEAQALRRLRQPGISVALKEYLR